MGTEASEPLITLSDSFAALNVRLRPALPDCSYLAPASAFLAQPLFPAQTVLPVTQELNSRAVNNQVLSVWRRSVIFWARNTMTCVGLVGIPPVLHVLRVRVPFESRASLIH